MPPFRHMITEWIDGRHFHRHEGWLDLEPELRLKLQQKIGHQLQLLRLIPPPHPQYYGRINNQPFAPGAQVVSLRNRDFCGPFHTYEAFLKRFYDSFRCTVAAHSTRDGTKKDDIPANASLYASIFFDNISMDAKAYESKLTHGDLQLHNIIFVSPSNGLDKVEDLDPVLIDWETLAWMPAWAEVTRILHEFGSSTHHFRDLMAFSKEIRPFLLADAEYAMHMSDATGLVGFI